MNIPNKSLDIFCGTGGVGKTTLATSRALWLAGQGKKVLLITIDPAKRLKQILGLDENSAGKIVKSNLENQNIQIDALLMNPSSTMERIAKKHKNTEVKKNRILEVLFRPYGGMNEIMAIIEVENHISQSDYDTIVLDTPPGSHFLDFLQSCNKIKSFFAQDFVQIFQYLGKKMEGQKDIKNTSSKIMGLLIGSGVKKLLSYLEKVTGKGFVEDFVDAIWTFFQLKESFLKALDFQAELKREDLVNWFLVTSVEHNKAKEAKELNQEVQNVVGQSTFTIVNKCSEELLLPALEKIKDENLLKLVKFQIDRETNTLDIVKTYSSNIYKFNEVSSPNPMEHVLELTDGWNQHAK